MREPKPSAKITTFMVRIIPKFYLDVNSAKLNKCNNRSGFFLKFSYGANGHQYGIIEA